MQALAKLMSAGTGGGKGHQPSIGFLADSVGHPEEEGAVQATGECDQRPLLDPCGQVGTKLRQLPGRGRAVGSLQGADFRIENGQAVSHDPPRLCTRGACERVAPVTAWRVSGKYRISPGAGKRGVGTASRPPRIGLSGKDSYLPRHEP